MFWNTSTARCCKEFHVFFFTIRDFDICIYMYINFRIVFYLYNYFNMLFYLDNLPLVTFSFFLNIKRKLRLQLHLCKGVCRR